jgi:hypothetical protein
MHTLKIMKTQHNLMKTPSPGELYATHLNQKSRALEYYQKLPAENRAESHILESLCNLAVQVKSKKALECLKETIDSVAQGSGAGQLEVRRGNEEGKH